jgi:translation initiation factor IF-1
MVKEDALVVQWEVLEILWWWVYLVKPTDMDIEVRAQLAWKMRMHKIKILVWDIVQVELNQYEPSVGRIVYRWK